MNKVIYTVAISISLVLLSACGGWASIVGPQPTTKHVTMADLEGKYTFRTLKNTLATVELSASGSFTITGSREYDGTGSWSIDSKNVIDLDYNETPRHSYQGWFVADDDNHSVTLVGGEGDGDWWEKMMRIR